MIASNRGKMFLNWLRWAFKLCQIPPHGARYISHERLNDAQMRRAVTRSKAENWKDIAP